MLLNMVINSWQNKKYYEAVIQALIFFKSQYNHSRVWADMHFLLTCPSLCHYWHYNNGARSLFPHPPPCSKPFQSLIPIYTIVRFSISETVWFLQQHKIILMTSESVSLTQFSAGPVTSYSTEVRFGTFTHSQGTFLCPFSSLPIFTRKHYPAIQIHQTGVSRQGSTDCYLPPYLQFTGNPSSQASLLLCHECSSLQRLILSQQLHPGLLTQ